jgi:hypothetical protein
MLVLQQIAVLPKGCGIIITDEGKRKTSFMKSTSDGSLMFDSAQDADTYYKIYSRFRCEALNVEYFEELPDVTIFTIEVRGVG